MDLNAYDYVLPEKNLALKPAAPRDASKLFVYDTTRDSIVFDHFYNLDKHIGADSFLVLNNTKVLPARVVMKKETRKIVTLFLPPFVNPIKAFFDRKVNVGEKIFFDKNNFATVIRQAEYIFTLKYAFPQEKLFSLLTKYGSMPIPPYLKETPLKRDQLLEKYQTIFARF